jgi:NADH-quinone oxidoreductase subunit N
MIIVILGGLGILCIDLINKNLSKSLYVMLSILVLVIDLGVVIGYSGPARGMFDMILSDGIATLGQIIILVASMLFIPLALTSKRFHEYSHPEFFALFLFMTAGFQFMVATDNLMLIFIGLETASLSLYTIIALHNLEKSFEAAIKYFTMGALAAGFFVFSAMLIYAVTGSVELHNIAKVVASGSLASQLGLLGAVAFMFAALGFKLSFIPFHTWVPDVYEGASAATAGYISIVPKIAGLIVALRFFDIFITAGNEWIYNVLYVIIIVTMTFANIMALVQDSVKRMLAYSSISHAGFVMTAVLVDTTAAHNALFLYWIMFTFTNLGAFAMLWISRYKKSEFTAKYDHPYQKFAGMVTIKPIAATIMAIFMLSLAGVPPFALFWGKLYLLGAIINSGNTFLAILMVINSAIAAYYYLKLVVFMFLKEPDPKANVAYMKNASTALKTIVGFSAAVTILAIFTIEPFLEMISSYVVASGF